MLTMSDAVVRARRTDAHKTAVVCGDVELDHAALAERCERVVAALAALGIRRGDRVAVLAANCHRYMELYLGVPAAGAVLVPMNTRLAPAELVRIVDAARPVLLVTDRDPGELADAVDRVVGWDEWEDLLAAAQPAGFVDDVTEDDVALLYFTSGTTGRPKGVALTHRNVVANSFHKTLACRLQSNDVFLCFAPFFHVAGTAPVLSLVWLGGTLVVLPAFDPAAVLDTVEARGITVAMPVPTMLAALTDEQAARPRDVSSLRMLGHAGSPITTAVIRRAHTMFPGAELMQFYGATETAAIITCMPHEEDHLGDAAADGGSATGAVDGDGDGAPAGKLGSCGQPVVGVRVEVVDTSTGRRCSAGEIGEVVVQGPNVMREYWENPEATEAAFLDGWYRMGDVGYFDDDRYLFLLDRSSDMIVTGGENVYSIEVEEVLARHPAVVECAVFGVPDERWVEAVHALVVVSSPDLATPELAEELRAHCRESIAGFKVPKRIELRSEPFPKSGPGKVQKRQLKEPYWAGR